MYTDILIDLVLVVAYLLILGTIYAAYIYKHSFDHGWTWLSVVIGDAITDIGTTVALLTVLHHYGLLPELWWIILFPVTAHICTGLPMITGQVVKKIKQDKRKKELEQEIRKGITNGKN